MKFAFSSLLLAAHALSVLCAPQSLFVSEYEDDGKALTQSRKSGGSLIDRLREDKRFSRFVEVIEKERGLRDDLENRERQTTVFAPTNAAFKAIEDQWANSRDEHKPQMRDILRYHIAPDAQISGDCLHAGALLPTDLRLETLEDRHQRIRVFRFHNEVWLNMHSRVVDKDIEADNGRIHAIDRVLCPPKGVTEMLYTMPSTFSTSLAAFERVGMASDLESKKGVTVFAPSNRAWEGLGYDNLRYLFSCVGQKMEKGGRRNNRDNRKGRKDRKDRDDDRDDDRDEDEERRGGGSWCQGTKDLQKIVEYHVANKLAYSTDLMEKETTKLETICGSKITVCAKRREGEGRESRDEKKHRDVRRYNFVINNGEARIQFTDGLANNGAIQVIDNVLIPKEVKLPHDRWVQ